MLRALLSACRRPSSLHTSSPAGRRVLWQAPDTAEGSAIQQHRPYPPPQPGGWERRRRSGPPPCLHFLRGSCRYGTACRFSHDTEDQAAAALPFHHRQPVVSQANAAAAAAAEASPARPWRLRVMSYNILADCLAHEHAAELYSSAPRWSLEWGYRGGLILREILQHRPDVVCLQEVDHFREFQQALQTHGYEGFYTKRTGDRRDGLAMFWRADAVRPVQQRTIEFRNLHLKDNVAQLVAFEQRGSSGGGGGGGPASSQTSSEGSAGSSVSGQKRRAAEAAGAVASGAPPRHLRFDSSSESEGEGGPAPRAGSGKRRGGPSGGTAAAAAAAAALQSATIEDAVAGGSGSGEARVEDATEQAGSDMDLSDGEGAAAARHLPALVVANIHVLFNPRRGDLKMGQVRTLLEHVDSMCLQQQKLSGQRAAAIVCGDFNSAAGSPIHHFVRTGRLELLLCDRKRMSGQVESSGHNWRALQRAALARQEEEAQRRYQGSDGDGRDAWPGQPPALGVGAAVAALAFSPQAVVPPYAPPPLPHSGGKGKSPRGWTADDVRLAAGSSALAHGGEPVARHPLRLDSAYAALTGGEASYSTCHDKFIGCVDYIHFTPGSGDPGAWRLLPLSALPPPPLQTLDCALPSPVWPSDHISLVCDFALLPGAAQPRGSKPRKARGSKAGAAAPM